MERYTPPISMEEINASEPVEVEIADPDAIVIEIEIEVFRALNTIIWETQPSDALPDVFFENNFSPSNE